MIILMNEKLFNKVPKKYREAIYDIYHDEDGYWIELNKGWLVPNYYAETIIHEDTQKELFRVLRTIRSYVYEIPSKH